MDNKLQTALITGPTSGIGKALAQQLASKGYQLLLVSRSEGKLAEMCQSLGEKHGIDVQYLVADLSQPSEARRVFEASRDLGFEVDLLVNNAGTHEYGPFVEAAWDDLASLMELNQRAVIHLTHLFLPKMLARGKGHILNLGSTGSFVSWPNDAIYGGGKAFILHFSEALAEELRGSGVGVTCLCPGAVDTAFQDKGNLDRTILNRLTAMAPEPVARAGLRAMERGKWVHVPGLINKLIVLFQPIIPRRLLTRLAKWSTTPLGDEKG